MPTIFLSHCNVDKRFVRRLKTDLESHGVKVWLDENEIHVGESIRNAIEKGLEKADFVAVVLSPSSLKRPWVNKEISAAVALEVARKRDIILPLLLGRVKLPKLLADKLYADFSGGYTKGFKVLLEAVVSTDGDYASRTYTESADIHFDIKRLDGTVVLYRKEQEIRCTRGTLNTYMERFSSTGDTADYRIEPGFVGRVWEEGGHTFVEHVFDRQLTAGQKLKRITTTTYMNTFSDAENYCEIRHDHPARSTRVTVRFPKGRPPLHWEAYLKHGVDRIDRSRNVRRIIDRGKPALRLVMKKPPLGTVHVLKWRW